MALNTTQRCSHTGNQMCISGSKGMLSEAADLLCIVAKVGKCSNVRKYNYCKTKEVSESQMRF